MSTSDDDDKAIQKQLQEEAEKAEKSRLVSRNEDPDDDKWEDAERDRRNRAIHKSQKEHGGNHPWNR